MLLTLRQVTYVLSTLVQLRVSAALPIASAGDEAVYNLLETLPPCVVFSAMFDHTFVIGAVSGVVIKWMDERVNG
jgi:hypothetical protein